MAGISRLTPETLRPWKDLPDDAYLDNLELRELLGVKHLGSLVANKLLPEPSQRHKKCSQIYKHRTSGAEAVGKFDKFSASNKLYWRLGALRAFATINENNADTILKRLEKQ